MRYLGIDYGEKRIGIALGDSETKIATPYGVVDSIDGVVKLVKAEQIEEIVIGVPYRLNGSKNGAMKDKVEDFMRKVSARTGKKAHSVNEMLTSKAADSLYFKIESVKKDRDAVAAMLILQDFLDTLKS